jgi:hypothetical protein
LEIVMRLAALLLTCACTIGGARMPSCLDMVRAEPVDSDRSIGAICAETRR